jgi:hypothetical protein
MKVQRHGVRWLASAFLLTLSLQVGAAALHNPLSHVSRDGRSGRSDADHHSSCGWCQLVSQFRSQTGAILPPPIPLPDQVVSLADGRSVAEPSQGVPLGPRPRAPPHSPID